MYCTPITEIKKAAKPHKCTWCGQSIEVKQPYKRWASVDDSWFTNMMHPECYSAMYEEMSDSWDFSYTPYDNERPTCAHETK